MHVVTQFVSASPATYALIFLVVAVDALLPFVQAEAVVITAAVLAAEGHLVIWLVIAVAACGGLVGDNVSYLLGNRVGCLIAGKLFGRGRRKAQLKRAERGVRRRGGLLILIARFIPVGRTATTLAAGTLEMPWRRFLVADAVAAALWAVYASMLGYAGGASFERNSWKPLAFAFGIAGALMLAVEGYRRVQKSRGRDVLSGDLR